jgi:hypothetical protein
MKGEVFSVVSFKYSVKEKRKNVSEDAPVQRQGQRRGEGHDVSCPYCAAEVM